MSRISFQQVAELSQTDFSPLEFLVTFTEGKLSLFSNRSIDKIGVNRASIIVKKLGLNEEVMNQVYSGYEGKTSEIIFNLSPIEYNQYLPGERTPNDSRPIIVIPQFITTDYDQDIASNEAFLAQHMYPIAKGSSADDSAKVQDVYINAYEYFNARQQHVFSHLEEITTILARQGISLDDISFEAAREENFGFSIKTDNPEVFSELNALLDDQTMAEIRDRFITGDNAALIQQVINSPLTLVDQEDIHLSGDQHIGHDSL